MHAFDKSGAKLGIEQIDLLVLHQPVPTRFGKTPIGARRRIDTERPLSEELRQRVGSLTEDFDHV